MNGLQRELLRRGWIDAAWVAEHAIGLEAARAHRRARTRPIACARSATWRRRTSKRRRSWSARPTARLDRPPGLLSVQPGDGGGMRGQQHPPPARDARAPRGGRVPDERAADGAEHARDRRRRRPAGVPQLGERRRTSASSPRSGTSTRSTIPHWSPPTHAMQIWRYAEQGSIGLLWISATNPAVSLPDLARIRADPRAPGADGRRAGPVPDRDRRAGRRRAARARRGARRPAASRTPTARSTSPSAPSTRRARRVRISTSSSTTRAAWTSATATATRSIKWRDAEGAFEAWKACSKGRPCDYSGLSHAAAARRPGHPVAVHRGRAGRHGAAVRRRRVPHRSRRRGDLRAGSRDRRAGDRGGVPRQATARSRVPARCRLPPVAGGDERRVPAAAHDRADALPLPYAHQDRARAGAAGRGAGGLGAAERERRRRASASSDGDRVRVRSPRGAIEGPARRRRRSAPAWSSSPSTTATGIRTATITGRAANELTITSWDPVSKQPMFKLAAVAVERAR